MRSLRFRPARSWMPAAALLGGVFLAAPALAQNDDDEETNAAREEIRDTEPEIGGWIYEWEDDEDESIYFDNTDRDWGDTSATVNNWDAVEWEDDDAWREDDADAVWVDMSDDWNELEIHADDDYEAIVLEYGTYYYPDDQADAYEVNYRNRRDRDRDRQRRQRDRSRRPRMIQVQGTIQKVNTADLFGHEHYFAKIELRDGRTMIADLGETEAFDSEPEAGDRISLRGMRHPVFAARQVKLPDQRVSVDHAHDLWMQRSPQSEYERRGYNQAR